MASPSSPSSGVADRRKYDVFLSFHGQDTRNNFMSFLYADLADEGVRAVMNRGFRRLEVIAPAMLKAIEESKISVVIFSENYASSPWCLDELAKIMDCAKGNGQIVLPIFYHVDPEDVRNQTGRFAKAFSEHEERFKDSTAKVQRWRRALTEAASIAGWDARVTGNESLFVDEIVRYVSKRLEKISSSDPHELIGMDFHVDRMESLLSMGCSDVKLIGIWGMGGIGKTTIARATFHRASSRFERCCFLKNIRENSEKYGFFHLRHQFISEVLRDENLSASVGITSIKDNLCRKKVLLVLDDVNNSRQLESLIGGLDCFGPGSRIIITTRDKGVFGSLGVNSIYEVPALSSHESLHLFSRNAFNQSHPVEDFWDLSKRAVEYAKGVPLAVEALSFLLRGRNKQEWQFMLHQLEKIPPQEMHNIIKISFDELSDEEKSIFLDIACFFKGEDVGHVTNILNGCGFSANLGIATLIDKCLLNISDNKLEMHDLVQEMGREIVRQESLKDPSKRSRLWNSEDVHYMLVENRGTEAVEGISLDLSKIRGVNLSSKAFARMSNLRLLKLYTPLCEEKPKVHLPQGLGCLSHELRYLHWHHYPLESLPSDFLPANLVELHMPYSHLRRLWKGTKIPQNLKVINLRYSQQLIETPDLSQAANLQSITLEGCASLTEVSLSIQYLSNLAFLNVKDCVNLKSNTIHFGYPEILNLSGCSRLVEFPELSRNIKKLYLGGTALEELPSSIENLQRLVVLDLENCTRLKSLTSSLCKLKSLQELVLSGCSRFENFPEILETMKCLLHLSLDGTAIKNLPFSIENLSGLSSLHLKMCKELVSLPASISHLKSLKLLALSGCSKLEKLPENLGQLKSLTVDSSICCGIRCQNSAGLQCPSSGLCSLMRLHLNDCNIMTIPGCLGCLSDLEYLYLGGNYFESLPAEIKQLSKLKLLDVSYCKRLQYLPELPLCLSYLDAHDCLSLESVSISAATLTGISSNFIFSNCFKLNIVSEALLRIRWMATAPLNPYEGKPPKSSAVICLPGAEIPDWFVQQRMGSSITIPVPQRWCDSQFLCFALCAVVSFEDYNDGGHFSVKCEQHFKNNDGERKEYVGYSGGWFDEEGKHRFIGSDHMFMWYDCFSQCCDNEVSFEFYAMKNNESPLSSCKVKKCGVRLMYLGYDSKNDLFGIQSSSPCEMSYGSAAHWDSRESLEEGFVVKRRK